MGNGEQGLGLIIMLDIKFHPNRKLVGTSGVKWQRLGAGKQAKERWRLKSFWVGTIASHLNSPCLPPLPGLDLSLCFSSRTTSCRELFVILTSKQLQAKETAKTLLPLNCIQQIQFVAIFHWWYSLAYRERKRRHETLVLTINWLIHTCTIISSAWIIATLGFFWQLSRNAMQMEVGRNSASLNSY